MNKTAHQKRPSWLKVKAPVGENFAKLKKMIRSKSLHTVCEEAHCPNISECWNCGTATFIILGDVCSRNCRFCAITSAMPKIPDTQEPKRVADSIFMMNLRHAVITSVTRDDLVDGGSQIWADTIHHVRKTNPETTIEVLIPDFNGDIEALERVFVEKPNILNHNIETVPRLYSEVRPQANYQTSLKVLELAKKASLKTKSGIMVGLGESKEEVIECMNDLRWRDVNILTIGQYLQPTKQHLAVFRFVHPDEFAEYSRIGKDLGFQFVESAPLVRSSYHAEKHS